MSDPIKPTGQKPAISPSSCTDLLACPCCGGHASLIELRYANTGSVYGYVATCDMCCLELRREPAGWTDTEEAAMKRARASVVDGWNARHANTQALPRGGAKTA